MSRVISDHLQIKQQLETSAAAEVVARTNFIRVSALAALTTALVALCVLIAIPLLAAITWGVALAIIAWPLHRRVKASVNSPKIAAGFTTTVVMTLILGAGLFVTYHLARETAVVADNIHGETAEPVREKLTSLPGMQTAVNWMERIGVDLEVEVRKFVANSTGDIRQLAQGSMAASVQFLVATFILFYLLLEPAGFRQELRDLLPLSREEGTQVLSRAADAVHASLYANLVTSFIDAIGGGLMFWALGLSEPVLWGCVMFVLSLLPIVGNGLVWVPAVLFLSFGGHWGSALLLTSWGVLTFILVDNFLYFRLVGTRMRLHEVPTLVAFLGGLAIFGISGMVLGPAILAVTVALLRVWKQRLAVNRDSLAA